MNSESQAEAIFLRIVELDSTERERLLNESCNSPELRQRVQELLDWDARVPPNFLDGAGEELSTIAGEARIGPYRILERLGEGGMGTVYAARQNFPERDVALKVLRAGRVSESAIRRFHHEIDVLGRLQHTGIARIYDAGVVEERDRHGGEREVPYFTMELVRGVPLVAYARKNNLGLAERFELLARVCDAVHYAHQRGVIHRDLKTENVLVSTDESSREMSSRVGTSTHVVGQPKVLDFGIARMIDPELGPHTRYTMKGALVGTLATMSPEQISGRDELVDVRTDVYALGVMLYELMCDRAPLPLDGLAVPQAIERILETVPESPDSINPKLKGDPTTIAMKALAKEADRRYQTPLELANDLRCFLRGEPIEARASSRLYLLRRSLRRHRLAVGVATAFTLTLAVFSIMSVDQARKSADLARSEREARDLSDQDFKRALEAVDLMTELGVSGLLDVPNADPARRRLLGAALDFHRSLIDAHPEKEGLQHRQGQSRYRIAVIEKELGNRVEALRQVEMAIEQLEVLREQQEAEPSDVDAGLLSARTLYGFLLHRDGAPEAAREQFERAALEAEYQIETVGPGHASWHHLLELAASNQKHLSNCLEDLGEVEASMDALDTSRAALELALQTSDSIHLKTELVATLQQMGATWVARGKREGLEELFLESIELGQQLLDSDPDIPRFQINLTGIRTNFGVALLRWERFEESDAQLGAAIELGERAVREHPGIEAALKHLSSAYLNRANLRQLQDDLPSAESDMARGQELLERIMGPDPPPVMVGRLATFQNNLATLRLTMGDVEGALETFTASLENAEASLEHLPGRVEVRTVRRYALSNSALCRNRLGQHEAATELLARIQYENDGNATFGEISRVLNQWAFSVELAELDEELEDSDRNAMIHSYFAGATTYLRGALQGGYQEFEGLLEHDKIGLLMSDSAFEEVMRLAGE